MNYSGGKKKKLMVAIMLKLTSKILLCYPTLFKVLYKEKMCIFHFSSKWNMFVRIYAMILNRKKLLIQENVCEKPKLMSCLKTCN